MKVACVVALFVGAFLVVGLANVTELSAASHAPGKTRANPEPRSEMSYDQGALWTSDYGPSYDISRPEDEDPLAGLPIGTAGVVRGSQLSR
jgi:hypothetical protein